MQGCDGVRDVKCLRDNEMALALSLPFSFWSNQTRIRGVPDRCIDVSVFSQEWLDFKEPLELFND